MLKLIPLIKQLQSFFPISMAKKQPPVEVSSILSPPETVSRMTTWQPELFKKTISVPYLKFPEAELNQVQKKFKNNMLKVPQLKPIIDSDETGMKRVLLDPEQISSFNDFNDEDRQILEEKFGVTSSHFGLVDVELNVNNFVVGKLLRAVLPTNEVEGFSSFSNIGHIVHVNLKQELLPYKQVIGQILLQFPRVRMVVNKSSIIDSTYRNFDMEILAKKSGTETKKMDSSESDLPMAEVGSLDNDFIVDVRENGTSFRFDFSKVYWNPRLSNEHQRLVDFLKAGDVLYDVFAGVGPFSIPAAKKALYSRHKKFIRVFANDLNPNSFDWLKHNFQLNKIPSEQYSCFNKDGKDFILQEIKEGLVHFFQSEDTESNVHISMNLPALAVEFLHHFHGLLDDVDIETFKSMENKKSPLVHVYSFSKCDKKEEDIRIRCAQQFEKDRLNDMKVSFVRNVAPHKDMFRATFPLSLDLLIRQQQDLEEPNSKKLKL